MIADILCKFLLSRFEKQYTFCFCPKCGLELCNSKSWFSDTDLVRYHCVQCGHESAWLFDTPVPLLVEGRITK